MVLGLMTLIKEQWDLGSSSRYDRIFFLFFSFFPFFSFFLSMKDFEYVNRYYIYPSQHFHFLLNGWVKAKFVTYNHSRLLGHMQLGAWGGEAPLNTASS